MFSGEFGEAGQITLVEDFLDGEEVSFFALCDGTSDFLSLALRDGLFEPSSG
jgi:phosphoribosylamine---glycine ligase